jgi:hypothetical protein
MENTQKMIILTFSLFFLIGIVPQAFSAESRNNERGSQFGDRYDYQLGDRGDNTRYNDEGIEGYHNYWETNDKHIGLNSRNERNNFNNYGERNDNNLNNDRSGSNEQRNEIDRNERTNDFNSRNNNENRRDNNNERDARTDRSNDNWRDKSESGYKGVSKVRTIVTSDSKKETINRNSPGFYYNKNNDVLKKEKEGFEVVQREKNDWVKADKNRAFDVEVREESTHKTEFQIINQEAKKNKFVIVQA